MITPKPIDDCSLGHAGPALAVDEARARLLSLIAPVDGIERVPLRAALGRTLARDVVSPIDVPGHDNSAMDGYALRAADLGGAPLRMVGTAWAGHPLDARVEEGGCARIFTGAPMPAGADTVVMQEHVALDGEGRVVIERAPRPGDNVRRAGEDIPRGAVALAAGSLVRSAELGLLGSLGLAEVVVRRRPRVAFAATGDELVPVGQALGPGQIHDSNSHTLYAMLVRLGVEPVDLGILRDDPAVIEAALARAAAEADLLITSGGVSVGDADHVTDVLRRMGEVHFWKIAMRPGRPLAFGRIGGAWFFGLPGNPVSVMATFHQIVQPALLRLMGREPAMPLTVRARLLGDVKKKPGRLEFVRGVLSQAEDGGLAVASTGAQGSGMLNSMSRANCFILLPQDSGPASAGEQVEVQPFAGWVW